MEGDTGIFIFIVCMYVCMTPHKNIKIPPISKPLPFNHLRRAWGVLLK